MIETITTGVNLACAVIYYCLYFSYKTGQFLVTAINVIQKSLITLAGYLLEVHVIIYESFSIFSQDVAEDLRHAFRIIFNIFEVIQGGISTALCNVINTIETLASTVVALYNVIVNIILSAVTGIGEMFVFFKRVLVLFGSGVWFSITFIPLLIVYIGTLITYYIGRVLEEIIGSISRSVLNARIILQNIYEFLTDVPVESAAGLLVATCLLYIFTQFYIVIYSYIYLQFHNAVRKIHQRFSRLRRHHTHNVIQGPTLRIGTSPRSRQQIRRELNSPTSPKDEIRIDDRYCVICQEHIKCILVLPCRHVCMCSECSQRLQLYNNVCPICRNDIESTMKIFV